MSNAIFLLPSPRNEAALNYSPGSTERQLLKDELSRQYCDVIDIPLLIGGKEIRTNRTVDVVCPHEHGHVLGHCHQAGAKEISNAIDAALKARHQWAITPWHQRASVFLKAADLITKRYRFILNAATMLNQSKTAYQAEIDSACEAADFLRCNVKFMEGIYEQQPESCQGCWNRMEYRPLEGFVLAITPFNFTAIAVNLTTAPAMMGNVVLWKPASTALLSGYYLMKLFKEAGLPDGVINFIPTSGALIEKEILQHEELAGIHFTGSTRVFRNLWRKTSENLDYYRSFPRLVGETGGKDYIFAHETAIVDDLVNAIVRGSFEYQGQKCSACSRVYVPDTLWPNVLDKLRKEVSTIRIGDIKDFTNLMGAVIDEKSYDDTMAYILRAKESSFAEVIIGGNGDKSKGYFIEPTVILAKDPYYETMVEELFAPVVTIFVYEASKMDETLVILAETSLYALTGAIFARDRSVIEHLENVLADTAGNLYINDKPTGAIVGQQPFGGSRGSGTNDKAGSPLNLLRWVSPRTIKENFYGVNSFKHPSMEGK